MKPETTTLVVVPPELITELVDFFLGLFWVLEYQSSKVTEIVEDRQKLFLKPLDLPIEFQSSDHSSDICTCNTSVATHILRFLVMRLVKDRDLDDLGHLFLKVLSPQLQLVLRSPDFGDETPLMIHFLRDAGQYFMLQTNSLGRPYWSIKGLYAMRAFLYIQKKSRWAQNIARTLYRGHQKLRNKNKQLGLGLVSVPFHSF